MWFHGYVNTIMKYYNDSTLINVRSYTTTGYIRNEKKKRVYIVAMHNYMVMKSAEKDVNKRFLYVFSLSFSHRHGRIHISHPSASKNYYSHHNIVTRSTIPECVHIYAYIAIIR